MHQSIVLHPSWGSSSKAKERSSMGRPDPGSKLNLPAVYIVGELYLSLPEGVWKYSLVWIVWTKWIQDLYALICEWFSMAYKVACIGPWRARLPPFWMSVNLALRAHQLIRPTKPTPDQWLCYIAHLSICRHVLILNLILSFKHGPIKRSSTSGSLWGIKYSLILLYVSRWATPFSLLSAHAAAGEYNCTRPVDTICTSCWKHPLPGIKLVDPKPPPVHNFVIPLEWCCSGSL